MKRILFLLSITLMCLYAFSQDLIITNDGRQIECKIIEMNDDIIKYSPSSTSNNSSSKFMILRSDVTNVQFGIVEQKTQSTVEQPETDVTEIENQIDRIYRDNGEFRYKGVYVSRKQVESILRKDHEANKHLIAGNKMAVGGLVCSCAGLVFVASSFAFLNNLPALAGMCAAGGALGIVGLGLTLGQLAKFNKAIDIYNAHHNDAALRLNFYASPTDIGIALNF